MVQLRRKNVCGCLGHRHVVVKEAPFSEPHDAFGDAAVGEMDIAFDRVESWLAQPMMDTALDTQFIAGSRLEEFHDQQLRFRLLSILLHETHHMVAPQAPERRGARAQPDVLSRGPGKLRRDRPRHLVVHHRSVVFEAGERISQRP